ncbi:hypothetical protein [Streptomyces sp. HSG2]|uniref:hypothetical protein n=1 Tax=Streptomyces sp. HSG2 TaxID=2797167 RepID=UPI001903F847|nr:hypothetical protein [Streptomyces sp. HSG2]
MNSVTVDHVAEIIGDLKETEALRDLEEAETGAVLMPAKSPLTCLPGINHGVAAAARLAFSG